MTPDHHTFARLPDRPPLWLQSYPAHLSRPWTLPSGEALSVRSIRHDDDELEEAFVARIALSAHAERRHEGDARVDRLHDAHRLSAPHGLRRNHGERRCGAIRRGRTLCH